MSQKRTGTWLTLALAILSCLASAQQFKTPAYYKVGPKNASLIGAVTADFNGDGLPDLAVIESNFDSIAVLLNQGSGNFSKSPKVLNVGGGATVTMATGDLNGDGIPDLVVVATNRPQGHLLLFLGKGDGTFVLKKSYSIGNGVQVPALADFNHDGKLDVAVTNYQHAQVNVFFGNGDGTLQDPKQYTAPLHGTAIAAADLNNDKFPDLVIGGVQGTLSVLLNKGDGTFGKPGNYKVGTNPVSIAVGDLKNNGIKDIVVASQLANQISVLLGNGDGTFGKPTSYSTKPIGNGPMGAVIADFNQDGNLDIAVTAQATRKNGAGVFYGKGDGTFGKPSVTALKYQGGDALVTADFDDNGSPDLAVTGYFGYTMGILLNVQ
jgi:VCBS repeat protein